jgi:hypothetical protein
MRISGILLVGATTIAPPLRRIGVAIAAVLCQAEARFGAGAVVHVRMPGVWVPGPSCRC